MTRSSPPVAPPPLRVLAAASLTEVVEGLAKDFAAGAGPARVVETGFGASSDLARQIRDGAPADVFASARERYTEEELVNLTLAVIAINGWNRLAIAFRPEVGKYQPRGKTEEPGPPFKPGRQEVIG